MQRTNIFLTEEQQRRLDRRAREQGVTKSGLIRRILDEALGIAQTQPTAESVIRATSGAWAQHSEAELKEVLRWRAEPPLDRLTR